MFHRTLLITWLKDLINYYYIACFEIWFPIYNNVLNYPILNIANKIKELEADAYARYAVGFRIAPKIDHTKTIQI